MAYRTSYCTSILIAKTFRHCSFVMTYSLQQYIYSLTFQQSTKLKVVLVKILQCQAGTV